MGRLHPHRRKQYRSHAQLIAAQTTVPPTTGGTILFEHFQREIKTNVNDLNLKHVKRDTDNTVFYFFFA